MSDQDATGAPPPAPLVIDRALPLGLIGLTVVFTTLVALAWGAVALLPFFILDFVAISGDRLALAPLLVIGATCLAVALVLEVGFAHALWGQNAARHRTVAQTRLVIGALLGLSFAFVSPLLLIPLVLAGAALIGAAWVRTDPRFQEPLWAFQPREAAAILAGRDQLGLALAAETPLRANTASVTVKRGGVALGGIGVLGAAAWLYTHEVVTWAAVPTLAGLALLALWYVAEGVDAALDYWRPAPQDAQVRELPGDPEGEDLAPPGLQVRDLTLRLQGGRALLTDINLMLAPGTLTAITGRSGSGKSLLMQALADPFALSGVEVRGSASVGETSLWYRSGVGARLTVVHVPPHPPILPASGLDNLAAFTPDVLGQKGRKILEGMLFSAADADRVISTPDATRLAGTDAKALGLARAFTLAPPLYLFDRPEDQASEALIAALCQRISMERRAGRTLVVVTENRALLDMCDSLICLEDGRVIDFGPADQVRARMSAGWSRLVTNASLDSEDALISWIGSHFRRDGDAGNRRKVSLLASELLALACPAEQGEVPPKITFDFKHYKGHCVLRLEDGQPPLPSSAFMRAEAEGDGRTPRGPLARLQRDARAFTQETLEDGTRRFDLTVETYDPRLVSRAAEAAHD